MNSNPCMTPVFRLAPIALALAQFCSTACAQSDTLPSVVVTGSRDTYVVSSTSAATRTPTPVQQIPQSVVSIPKALVVDQGVTSVSDALRNVSNVNTIDMRDANNVTFKIRGFNAALVVDGMAMPGVFSNFESLVNVEQIDVLKGPAGNLFGSGQGASAYATMGGTIAITTSAPHGTPERSVGVSAGNYGAVGAHFDVNQPLSSDVAVRLVGEASRSGSESDGVFFRKNGLYPSLSWTPNAGRSVVIRARVVDGKTSDYSGLPTVGTLDTSSFTIPRSTHYTADGLPDSVTRTSGLNVQWAEKLTDQWTANVTLAHNKAFLNQKSVYVSADQGYGAGYECFGFGATGSSYNACGLQMWVDNQTTTFSPSLTGKFEALGAQHVVSTGVDIERTRDHEYMAYSNGAGLLGTISLLNPSMPTWVEPVTPADDKQQHNTYKSRAVYLQDQVNVGNWHLTGGLRYSRIEVVDIYNDGVMFANNNVSTNSKLTPRLGAVYDLTPAVSTFVGYSEGIKIPMGANFATPPKPEEFKQTEVGLKLAKWQGVTATVAWFDLQRRNAAATDPTTFKSYQIGQQQSTGVDADVTWRASSTLTVLAALSVQTAKVTENNLDETLVDKQLFNVPEKSARLAARYEPTGEFKGWGAGLGMTYRDALPGNDKNTYFTPAVTLWDAQLSYRKNGVRYGLNVSNLFDKKYFVPSAYFAGGNVIPAVRRTLAATADFSF
jgi:iron complex outermembrane receptor protein